MAEATEPISLRRCLEEWQVFLLAGAHILRRRPELLFQQAANEPDRTAPARAVRARMEAGLEVRPCFQYVNKPQSRSACLMTLAGHTNWVKACAFSPDGIRIISGSGDQTLKFWDAETGGELATLAGHTEPVTACVFSPDGHRIVSAPSKDLEMRSVQQLQDDFRVYLDEMDNCERRDCYWALLHLVLAIPDICGALESGSSERSGRRSVKWCENLPTSPVVKPGDRWQMRNAVLHQGTTIAENRSSNPDEQTRFRFFSFPDPRVGFEIHQAVNENAGEPILTLDIKKMADDVRTGLNTWFVSLQTDPRRMAEVEANIGRLARRVPKRVERQEHTKDGRTIDVVVQGPATSSTGYSGR